MIKLNRKQIQKDDGYYGEIQRATYENYTINAYGVYGPIDVGFSFPKYSWSMYKEGSQVEIVSRYSQRSIEEAMKQAEKHFNNQLKHQIYSGLE